MKDLVVYASGDRKAIKQLEPLFLDFARQVHHLGAFGNGSRMKYVANLLVAGRCISTTRYVHQATKEIPAAMATGEAAGAAAARAVAADVAVQDVDVGALRADLRSRGAFVGGVD